MSQSVLDVEGLTKRFGGLVAVRGVSFTVRRGEIVGLIGPNGAGKTTVFNLISGLLRPDAGRILLLGRDLAGLRPHVVAHLGIGRTFQIVRPFLDMTVLENAMVAAFARTADPSRAADLAADALTRVGLQHRAGSRPGALTLAERKRLEMARALAGQPELLLLDEVLAGLNPSEVAGMLPVIRQIQQSGVTILMIEHIMTAIMTLSDRVLVLNQGERIAEGTPAEIARNPRVIEAYLGEELKGA